MSDQYIIFFDGQCNLCDRFVNFVFKRDINRQFLYAPLQGVTAKQRLKEEDIKDLKSIIVLKNHTALKESQAIKVIMQQLYPRYSSFLSLLPSSFFNVFYKLIAKRRYKIFGKKDNLYHPSKDQRKCFLP